MEINKHFELTDDCANTIIIKETKSDDESVQMLSLEIMDDYFYFESIKDVDEFCELLKKIAKDHNLK